MSTRRSQMNSLLSFRGNSAKQAQQKLEAALKENNFERYTIFTEDKTGALHVEEYVGPRYEFGVTKETLTEADGQYQPIDLATCELVLEGDIVHAHDEPTELFAVVSGHFILDEGQKQRMQCQDAHEAAREEIRKEIVGSSDRMRIIFQTAESIGKVNLRLTPTIFAYRHFPLAQALTEDFRSYVNDIALLQMESQQLQNNSGRCISREQIKEGMREVVNTGGETAALDVIIPLRNPYDLIGMSLYRVCVKVVDSSGYMILGKDVSRRLENAIDIVFILEEGERRLSPGQSGSIVYVIDSNTGVYYRFGQFIGKLYNKHPDGMDMYNASVLRQSIDEIEARYGHVVRNLRPIGQHAIGQRDASDVSSFSLEHKGYVSDYQ